MQQHASDINFLYACTTEKTLMIDLQGSEISEIDLAIIINFAHQEVSKFVSILFNMESYLTLSKFIFFVC